MSRNIFNGKPIIDPSVYNVVSSILPEKMFTIDANKEETGD